MLDRELESFLRQFEPLKYVDVGYKSPELSALAPFLVTVAGNVSLHGVIHRFEADVDLRELGSPGDLERLVALILAAIERASNTVTLH
jgi:hypothetical protein